jgi:hypothetical protein
MGPIRAGLTYGTILWLFAQAVAVPTLGVVAASIHANAAVSPGWIAARLGLVAALASLLAHLAYGSVLGFVYGCLFRARCLQTIR